jgi:hypothetical protein
MDGVRAVDGTDIGSRPKRRNYMRERNLADADDFKNQWAKQTAERARVHRVAKTGKAEGIDSKARRETIERAIYSLHKP